VLIAPNSSSREVLGKQTLWVMAAPDRVESFLLHRPRQSNYGGIAMYTILERGPELSSEQITALQMAGTPLSHYDGDPIFKRWPSVPGFAFRLHRGKSTLDLLVDLLNPGWEFHCDGERHLNWHWVGQEMKQLAKTLFPAYASEHATSMWKQGAMKKLAETYRQQG
jgi:hypothetical protein